MWSVLPGKPRATLQAVSSAKWNEVQFIVYITGNAIAILNSPNHLVQTIYNDEIEAFNSIAIDSWTGKIAAASGSTVYIYQPAQVGLDFVKWSLQCSLDPGSARSLQLTLSWGPLQELLVGSSELRLFRVSRVEELIWKRSVSSPVIVAALSPDAELIASYAQYDRLVKLWRRQSFGSEDVQFDHSYLSHPAAVTGLNWGKHQGHGHFTGHVLYTVCVDHKLRVWSSMDPHGLEILQVWADIDLEASMPKAGLGPFPATLPRFVFFIDDTDFSATIHQATTQLGDNHHADHLIEMASQKPYVCIVLDGTGQLSAWGLSGIGSKDLEAASAFNISHVGDFYLPEVQQTSSEIHARLLSFCSQKGLQNSLIFHFFDGRLCWFEGRTENLFRMQITKPRVESKGLLTGHEKSISKIIRTRGGRAIFSRTDGTEAIVWKQVTGGDATELQRNSTLNTKDKIHRTCLLAGGGVVAILHHHNISIWNARSSMAVQIASSAYKIRGEPLCLLQLPVSRSSPQFQYLATVSSGLEGIVWQVDMYQLEQTDDISRTSLRALQEYCKFDLGDVEDLSFVIPVDPAGSIPVATGFLDTFAKDVALSYTNSGVFSTWAADIDSENKLVKWLATATVHTGVKNPSLASASSIRKVALVDSSLNGLTLWDSSSAQLEFENDFGVGETIQDLDWTSTPDDQSVLAVGFPHRIIIVAQVRYDYLDQGPAWTTIREIDILDSTPHPIGDSVWLGNGSLVIGAGNQLFVHDKGVRPSDAMIKDLSIPTHRHKDLDLFDVVSVLNGPLPVYHPQFLSQCILFGKLAEVQKIIVKLDTVLKFFSEGDPLDSSLGFHLDQFLSDYKTTINDSTNSELNHFSLTKENEETDIVTDQSVASLNENLDKKAIPYLSGQEQAHLMDIIDCVADAEKQRRSMDENATRFVLYFRQNNLRTSQKPGRRRGITWREIAWAFHSGSQDILVDVVSRQYSGKMMWKHAKECGIFMWLTDNTAFRTQFEIMARNEYAKTEERNPVHCSLYFLALKKKNVLLGLWRMATWNREQASTQKLLSNDFSETRWKTVALKNAYALMGKRRFEYAAAFFVLAGNIRDAVNVCIEQMEDIQLAVAVARAYEGGDGPVLRELLEHRILPLAAFEGNRWLATWAFWMLGRRDMAVRALITPVSSLVDSPGDQSQQSKSYLATDPALVVLYRQLREKTLQTLIGATKIQPRAEWDFVLQIARIYDRMGCDILALDLVRNWEFLKTLPPAKKAPAAIPNPSLLLRRRSSLVVADLPMTPSPTLTKNPILMSPPPQKVFEEPEASSLLDSFGF